jgi:hypothetical protein
LSLSGNKSGSIFLLFGFPQIEYRKSTTPAVRERPQDSY